MNSKSFCNTKIVPYFDSVCISCLKQFFTELDCLDTKNNKKCVWHFFLGPVYILQTRLKLRHESKKC